ncbi:MAG TPA: alcohol dehydrogenase catalytic domain-containing protein, partial [Acetobacteraceae bacterium]|nr:alcohol dehydrogenase catalytic domain-containing protein [Acetobacteraceae bacterium]
MSMELRVAQTAGSCVHARAHLPVHTAGGGRIMQFRAAILEAPGQSLIIDTVETGPLRAQDVLVRLGAAGICHTDLEVIAGQLVYPMPIVLGHEAAGTIVDVGDGISRSRIGERVVLSWNPHCGHCFYCDAGQPILCETYTRLGPKAVQLDGCTRLHRKGVPVQTMFYISAFAEYCIVSAQCAIPVPSEMPLDRACLLGCG